MDLRENPTNYYPENLHFRSFPEYPFLESYFTCVLV